MHTSDGPIPSVLSQHPVGGLQYAMSSSFGFDGMPPHHSSGTPPGSAHHRASAPLSSHRSAPFSVPAHGQGMTGPPQSPSNSARGSFDGHHTSHEDPDSEALSTFHLPEGLAEQLSTSQPAPASTPAAPLPMPPLAISPAEQSLQKQHLPQAKLQPQSDRMSVQQQQHQAAGLGATQAQRQPKLRSPPGFSRPLDGAAKPFVPGHSTGPALATSVPQLQAMPAGSGWPQAGSSQAVRHMRPPPGMTNAASTVGGAQFSLPSPLCGHEYGASGQKASSTGKVQQHANLASGQWALANGDNGNGQHMVTPFSQPLASADRPFSADARNKSSSTSQWQVPKSHTMQPSLQHDRHAIACVFDTEQHETSGLAPNDVLDFLGIGSDDAHRSDTSQSLSDQHVSQVFS